MRYYYLSVLVFLSFVHAFSLREANAYESKGNRGCVMSSHTHTHTHTRTHICIHTVKSTCVCVCVSACGDNCTIRHLIAAIEAGGISSGSE